MRRKMTKKKKRRKMTRKNKRRKGVVLVKKK